jgi:hypothetical protein
MGGRRIARGALVAGGAFGVAFAASCSLVTSLDGLSGGPVTPGLEGGPTDAGLDASGANDATAGGDGSSGGPDASTKPRAWRQLAVTGPPPLHSARMVFDEARGKIVLVGGGNAMATSNDTWEWDGTAWSSPSITTKPTATVGPGLAYDSTRHVTMLFAGADGTSDPLEWDGGPIWRSSGASATSPNVRNSTTMTYDRARNVLVVFGGLRQGSPSSDNGETWEWSASAGFVNRMPALSPPARRANVLVYDTARARVVAFGGIVNGSGQNDLWEWDGASWLQRTPTLSPSPRRGACGAYDSARQVTVIFGGRPTDTDKSGLDDTWAWDGTAWKQGPAGPAGRSSCAMAYDSKHDQIVMYGGSPGHIGTAPSMSVAETWVYE